MDDVRAICITCKGLYSLDSKSLIRSDKKLKKLLRQPILEGKIEIESSNQHITIRIRESGSFPSASSSLDPSFMPTVASLRDALNDIEGEISIEGHSDNIPIYSSRYRSNWDLSAQRAVAVAEEVRTAPGFDEKRMSVVGKADTAPLSTNANPANRGQNRRVEISINQGKPIVSKPISVVEP